MKLWSLILCVAAVLAALVAGVGYLSAKAPGLDNDHLLDGVQGLGGPKR